MMQLGDTVVWTSASAGAVKTKMGEVVAVVPPGRDPGWMISPCLLRQNKLNLWRGEPRDHESYLVRVEGARCLYWPRVSQLRKVEGGEG